MNLSYLSYFFSGIPYFLILCLLTLFFIFIYFLFTTNSQKTTNLQGHILKIVNLAIIFPITISLIYGIFFFQSSFSSIFNNNIARVLEDSLKVAETYHKEYREKILSDAKSIASTINENYSGLITDIKILKNLLESYVNLKELVDAVVFIPSQNLIIAKNDFSFALTFDYIPNQIIESAGLDNPILIEDNGSNKIRALIRLDNFSYPTYLMIGRYMDEKVIEYIAETRKATSSYNIFTKKIHDLQGFFLLIFFGLLFLLIFTSKFIAKFLSRKLTIPLNNVVHAIKNVSNGDLSTKINENTNITELNSLTNSFNLMIDQLHLFKKQIISRGDFIEAIINQIPDGLMVFDTNYQIIIQNHSSETIINNFSYDEKIAFLDQLNSLIKSEISEKNQTINTDSKSFLINTTHANFELEKKSYLVTFTDITEHLAYQKNLLWIEIAKRITHEIRNPLTPIILSIERIEDKYLELAKNDHERDNFLRYIENIKKHTDDISIIIDEFVQFGRMPKMVKKDCNLVNLIQSAINSANFDRKIEYIFDHDINLDSKDLIVNCDDKQISRALLNIFKNGYEAMQNVENKKIFIKLKEDNDNIKIIVRDSGLGFPEKLLSKITQPYISTKAKGSGLGLAIVKKIIDDHGWQLNIYNDNGGVIEIIINKI